MLEIVARMEDDVPVIGLVGRLDAESSSLLETALNQALSDSASVIILDATGLLYTSSSGLRVMLAVQKQLKQRGGELRIAAPKPDIRKVLSIAGFLTVFSIRDSVEEALSG
ncbi:MAG: STAS domain-containing protein [Methanocalculus sp.]|uniref:STAS domain-containing protein n=1 Tax=Methanocalculus sp. TaxID=2004547 RepID=UPI002722910E|nr:STAS domain-containing protein [Methanocalculus sp.]MDO9540338.1 STAS domain-containing protein [Methanocalculus sp.]